MAALHLTTSLFCPHYWFSLLILGVLTHLHTFASTMWQSRYTALRASGKTLKKMQLKRNNQVPIDIMIHHEAPRHHLSTDLRSHLNYSAFYSSALSL